MGSVETRQELLSLGDEMLRALAEPITEGRLAEIEGLLTRRQELLVAAFAPPGGAPVWSPRELERLLDQQRLLEEGLYAAVCALRVQMAEASALRADLSMTGRMMSRSGASRLIDERR